MTVFNKASSWVLVWGLLLMGSAVQAQPTASKPLNILFVMADDWSWPHAGYLGDRSVSTPHIDALAQKGIVFTNSFCAVPSCTPSRASILTGRYPHQLEEGANLWGPLSIKYPNYTNILEESGYAVGYEQKGWWPASRKEMGGYARNPAGHLYENFEEFLGSQPAEKPFCYWFGSNDPHRPYTKGSGKAAGIDLRKIKVPGWLPDNEEIRNDLADYYQEVQAFDRDLGSLMESLRKRDLLQNTLILLTSDNGMPFPRAKANLYDAGTRMPLIIYWQGHFEGGTHIDAFVNHIDFAPTFLEAAGFQISGQMTGKSLVPLMRGERQDRDRNLVFFERERHGNVRQGDLAYPCRAVRTNDFLLIHNLRPERWPAGDSVLYWSHGAYGDVDGSPSKRFILANQHLPVAALRPHRKLKNLTYYQLAFGFRPAYELYDLKKDPDQLINVAKDPAYRKTLAQLQTTLLHWMEETGDPLAAGGEDPFEKYPFYGNPASQERKTNTP